VLVDIDPATLNLDLDAMERAVTPRTKAILPVHFGGLACDMTRILALAKARGSVVNIASMHAIFGAPLSPAYSASKGGIVQLTKSLAVAWAEEGIRVNALAPGWIETPMTVPARSDAAPPRDPGPHATRPVGHAG